MIPMTPGNPMMDMMGEALGEAFGPMVREAVRAELDPVMEMLTLILADVRISAETATKISTAIEVAKAKGGIIGNLLKG
jgi:hypothetical protein